MGRVSLPRSMSVIAIQPRNSTVQCIFLAQFTSQVLAFPMPRLPSPILDGNRFKRQSDRCHSLSTSHKPVLSPLCFHGFTNCFSRKPFTLRNICVAPRVSPQEFPPFTYSHPQTSQVLYVHIVAHSLSSQKKLSGLESVTCGLFYKNTRGGSGGAALTKSIRAHQSVGRWKGSLGKTQK